MNNTLTNEGPSTEAEYRAEKAQLEREHKEHMAKMESVVQTQQREAVKSAARAALLESGCRADAIGDVAAIVASKATFDKTGQPTIRDIDNMKNLSPEAFARKYVADRKFLQASHQSSGQTPPHARQAWDFDRALRDVHYNTEWEKADPEGCQIAWDAHIAKVMGTPKY